MLMIDLIQFKTLRDLENERQLREDKQLKEEMRSEGAALKAANRGSLNVASFSRLLMTGKAGGDNEVAAASTAAAEAAAAEHRRTAEEKGATATTTELTTWQIDKGDGRRGDGRRDPRQRHQETSTSTATAEGRSQRCPVQSAACFLLSLPGTGAAAETESRTQDVVVTAIYARRRGSTQHRFSIARDPTDRQCIGSVTGYDTNKDLCSQTTTCPPGTAQPHHRGSWSCTAAPTDEKEGKQQGERGPAYGGHCCCCRWLSRRVRPGTGRV
ncbi:hypothetical protein GMORB2_1376 [Geosmithia morbida]|uniref:Uncharacterized protein n=1 Tax=Geosmithia morbida TaxID=1094350 RepID=A0A9P4Z1V1_9HYPO|nr:uncharacterized protein GMORB2_1376 [Geosmithia morbida]KAF4126130.1 hypothetical protein GMORB2_1376 [Geosmithia morbida]